jgi:phosphatidylglycerol:prolipoprotein diacylglycerol transferase
MLPILARYGPFFLYSYTVLIGFGILAGIGLTAWRARRGERPYPNWPDGLLIGLLAGLIGGRVLFTAVNWDYFQLHPDEIWLWRQGIGYHGVLAGGLLAFWLWARRTKRGWAAYADLYAPGLVLAAAFVWLACLLDGTVYGRETVITLWSADLPDKLGVSAVRYQTQLMGIVWSLLWFGGLWGLRGRLAGGRLFWLALAGISLGRLLLSFLRGDPVPMLGAWRLDSVVDAAVLLVAAIGLFQRQTQEFPMGGAHHDE